MNESENLESTVSVSQLAGSRYDLLDLKMLKEIEDDTEPAEDLESLSGYVHSCETMGTADGPGIRFVLFMTGCPLRCQYCHNPDTWRLKNGHLVTMDDAMREIGKYENFLNEAGGGITISGGEPLVQPNFLASIRGGAKREIYIQHWIPPVFSANV